MNKHPLAIASIQGDQKEYMRLAIISSPRCGNTWLRRVLAEGLDLHEMAVHNYLDIQAIPERCILQLHWYREPNFQAFLQRHGFKVITLSRHPLDILLSVLHFIRYEPETARWLEGNCAIPASLRSATPASPGFLEYALGFGFENLLSVSYQWWQEETAIKVRYEQLVATAESEITRLARLLEAPAKPLLLALAQNPLARLQATPNRHGWRGQPGLWRDLIPRATVMAIHTQHHILFKRMGYTTEQTALAHADAEHRWIQIVD